MSGNGIDESKLVAELTEIWRVELLLGLSDPDADFLELNGTSLTAVRIASRITESTGHVVPVELLYDFSSPRTLANALVSGNAA
jgi:acyl carrier protein